LADRFKHPSDEKKIKFKPNLLASKEKGNSWIIIITILSFFLSATLLFATKSILGRTGIVVSLLIVFIIILVGIAFDMVGFATAAADETPFHAMASRKLYGARQAIGLIRNANKVSAFCNDVVGDICGIISGTASAFIIIKIAGERVQAETTLAGLAIGGVVASLTVGGKALGKTVAIENSSFIVYRVAVIVKFFAGKFYAIRRGKKKH
jgi:CBS domain containing-hemolysin-like protein